MMNTIRKNKPLNRQAKNTEPRAAFSSGTVKKRIRICGRPEVPNINAMPSEKPETGSAAMADGVRMAACRGWMATARSISVEKLKSNCASVRTTAARPL